MSNRVMLLAYLAITSVVAIARFPANHTIGWVLFSNALILLLLWLLNRRPPGSVGTLVNEIYPILLLGALYPAIDILNSFGRIGVHDVAVRGWELWLFGGEPSRSWWQSSHSPFWSTVFHGAYFAFYPIVLAPPIYYLVLGRIEEVRRAVSWIFATFLFCYLVFVLFPVAGPYYEFPRPDSWFLDNPMARLVYSTLDKGSAYGAAFPSSHVAATLVATVAGFKGSKTLGWILLLPAVLLTIGVVYCQMHYGVDALAGAFVAAGVIAVGDIGAGKKVPSTEYRG